MSPLERVLRREQFIIASGLAVLVGLAWLHLWRGAGMGMSGLDMTELTLFPHRQAEPMAGMEMEPFAWATAIVMWWTMMIAMMTPGAAPLVLLYGRVLRHHQRQPASSANIASPMFLAAGYLTVWLGFSLVAAVLQRILEPGGLISSMMLWSRSATLSAGVLAAAGVYQLSPLKRSCLQRCRAPIQFLTSHWRPGRFGAFVIGLRHGAWCVGCCWILMGLLFVGGLMNLAWIVALTLLVLIEKLAPAGLKVSRISGALLLAWSVATLMV
ncbi:MAG: DUF2182 domain-containing protein [Pseudomonadota bacterium]|nr:DUF2182 domain-containing protein [Pseudomonadota bacterium]